MKLFNKILLALGMTLCFHMFVLARSEGESAISSLFHMEEELTVTFKPYAEGVTEDNHVDTAFIDKIYVDGEEAVFNSFSDHVEYSEKHNAYSWSGDREATLTMRVRSGAFVSFRLGIYSDDAEIQIENVGFDIERGDENGYVDFSGLSGEDITQTYELSSTDYFRIWASAIFFCLSYALITFLSGLLDKYAERQGTESKLLSICCSPLFYILLWAVLARLYYRGQALEPLTGDDTYTYWIQSAGELSWYHRMPGYQLFIMAIQNIFRLDTEDSLFSLIADVQALLGIISCVPFYFICRKLTKRQWAVILGTALYAAHPAVLRYECKILTEALAIDMTIGFVWLMIRFLEKPTERRAFLIGPYCLLCILTRPSFLILLPIVLLFFIIYLYAECNGRRCAIWGLGGGSSSVRLSYRLLPA